MYKLKTKETSQDVKDFLQKIPDENVRKDCEEIIEMMAEITGEKAKMWRSSIIGFGTYHYKYDSGHEGDMCVTGFSPRKNNLSLYVMGGLEGTEDIFNQLGNHKASKGCLYIKKLEDVDKDILKKIIKKSVEFTEKTWERK